MFLLNTYIEKITVILCLKKKSLKSDKISKFNESKHFKVFFNSIFEVFFNKQMTQFEIKLMKVQIFLVSKLQNLILAKTFQDFTFFTRNLLNRIFYIWKMILHLTNCVYCCITGFVAEILCSENTADYVKLIQLL